MKNCLLIFALFCVSTISAPALFAPALFANDDWEISPEGIAFPKKPDLVIPEDKGCGPKEIITEIPDLDAFETRQKIRREVQEWADAGLVYHNLLSSALGELKAGERAKAIKRLKDYKALAAQFGFIPEEVSTEQIENLLHSLTYMRNYLSYLGHYYDYLILRLDFEDNHEWVTDDERDEAQEVAESLARPGVPGISYHNQDDLRKARASFESMREQENVPHYFVESLEVVYEMHLKMVIAYDGIFVHMIRAVEKQRFGQ